MNPLNSVAGVIIGGIVLAAIIGLATTGVAFNVGSFVVWIHVMAGITWIGLLYYFNFVQVPALADAAGDEGGPGGAGITKYVAPRALWWFRWSAALTWLSGASYLGHLRMFTDAFTLGMMGDSVNTQAMITAFLRSVVDSRVSCTSPLKDREVVGYSDSIPGNTFASRSSATSTGVMVAFVRMSANTSDVRLRSRRDIEFGETTFSTVTILRRETR